MRPATPSMLLLTALAACVAGAAEPSGAQPHREANPVFAELVSDAPDASAKAGQRRGEREAGVRLPMPVMADRLSGDPQREVIESVARPRYRVEDLLRPSTVAPHVLRMDRERIGGDGATLQRVSVYFAGRGDLEAISEQSFLDSLIDTHANDGESSRELSDTELKNAGIEVSRRNPKHDFYHRIDATLFDRIQLRGVSRTYWSRNDNSIMVAMMVDPRFANDAELQPTWERFERREDGTMASAETGRLSGAGLYIKITQLREPEGQLFVEAHLALIEPQAWFRGANLLGSKMPPAIQSKVRDVRRQFIRATTEHQP